MFLYLRSSITQKCGSWFKYRFIAIFILRYVCGRLERSSLNISEQLINIWFDLIMIIIKCDSKKHWKNILKQPFLIIFNWMSDEYFYRIFNQIFLFFPIINVYDRLFHYQHQHKYTQSVCVCHSIRFETVSNSIHDIVCVSLSKIMLSSPSNIHIWRKEISKVCVK